MKEIEFIKEYHLLERIELQSIFFSKRNDRQKKEFCITFAVIMRHLSTNRLAKLTEQHH